MMGYAILGKFMLALVGTSLMAALVLVLLGTWQLMRQRGAVPTPADVPVTRPARQPVSVHLEGKGPLTVEPGVLLNTLWEHLPNAECQAGECGGCKVRLLEGEVTWVREPEAEINRQTHILACSCEAVGPIRCATV